MTSDCGLGSVLTLSLKVSCVTAGTEINFLPYNLSWISARPRILLVVPPVKENRCADLSTNRVIV